MLIPNDDGTFTGGHYDVLTVLFNTVKKTYHPAYFEEYPIPGVDQLKYGVRLKSKFHHIIGSQTLVEAQILFNDLAKNLILPKENYFRDQVIEWNGEIGIVILLPYWK